MIEKGQIVYCEPGENAINKDIVEGLVEKVGRKYIEIKIEYRTYKFNKISLEQITNYSTDYHIYIDKQTIVDKQEYLTLFSQLRDIIDHPKNKLSLDKLRKIIKIVNS